MLSLVTIVVRDYDEALAFYVGKLGFRLLEDTDLGGKRWVRVRPPGNGTALLLARASNDVERAAIGKQTGGRVGFFLETHDLARDHAAFTSRGVRFVREPVAQEYGTVAVFEDPYGNRFDLIEPRGIRNLLDMLALPPPAPVPFSVHGERVDYRGDEDDPIAALLFMPEGDGPFPAVVAHHQHNSEWHFGKSEIAGRCGSPFQAFGPALARAGIAVLAPDMLTFEERRASGRGTEPHTRDWADHYNEMASRLVRGDLVMRKHLSDALRATSVLESLPKIDRTRIGVVGHSVGGMMALHHAAVDRRIVFGCSSGHVSDLSARLAAGKGPPMAELIPVAGRWTAVDVLAAAANRPFLVASGEDDPYSAGAARIVERARARGCTKLEHDHAPGDHALDAHRFARIVDWLAHAAEHLQDAPSAASILSS